MRAWDLCGASKVLSTSRDVVSCLFSTLTPFLFVCLWPQDLGKTYVRPLPHSFLPSHHKECAPRYSRKIFFSARPSIYSDDSAALEENLHCSA